MFAVRLKVARENAGMTQAGLAEACGWSPSGMMVSHYELGRRTPTIKAAATLARNLNVSVDWLLGMEG